MECPLCAGVNAKLLKTFEVSHLVNCWKEGFSIDVRNEFGSISTVDFYECSKCALRFFKPESVAGSPAIYEALEKIEWYYLPRKWEHEVALQDLDGTLKGIEIGCGFGDFVKRAIEEKKISFEGCEQNPSAVQVGQAKGVPIRLESFEDLAEKNPGAYDVVCSFQVLEHVTNPGDFLKCACRLLRPGGKLILGLPNADSFLKHEFNLLDLPPHHMSRWTVEVVTRLQAWFPLKLVRVAYEPLESTAVDRYVGVYSEFLGRLGLGFLVRPSLRSLAARVVNHGRVRRFLQGQGFYISYVRS